jgi:cell pole-organizing protein PopZ
MTEPVSTNGHDGADPSMEEILASIRRILNEDEAPQQHKPAIATPAMESAAPATDDDVLVLDRTMLISAPDDEPQAQMGSHGVDDGSVETNEAAGDVSTEISVQPTPAPLPNSVTPTEPEPLTAREPAEPAVVPFEPIALASGLLGPEAAAAAASSVDGLLRMLAANRSTQTHRGGPTIEDLVREEIRPLLKEWLDSHLPGLVERQVRAEIERVVGRAVS